MLISLTRIHGGKTCTILFQWSETLNTVSKKYCFSWQLASAFPWSTRVTQGLRCLRTLDSVNISFYSVHSCSVRSLYGKDISEFKILLISSCDFLTWSVSSSWCWFSPIKPSILHLLTAPEYMLEEKGNLNEVNPPRQSIWTSLDLHKGYFILTQ